MKTSDILELLGPPDAAAQAMGISRKTMGNWKRDRHGNIVSREVQDKVLAAGVRREAQRRLAQGEGLDDLTRRLLGL